jgi:hypothetical protein
LRFLYATYLRTRLCLAAPRGRRSGVLEYQLLVQYPPAAAYRPAKVRSYRAAGPGFAPRHRRHVHRRSGTQAVGGAQGQRTGAPVRSRPQPRRRPRPRRPPPMALPHTMRVNARACTPPKRAAPDAAAVGAAVPFCVGAAVVGAAVVGAAVGPGACVEGVAVVGAAVVGPDAPHVAISVSIGVSCFLTHTCPCSPCARA